MPNVRVNDLTIEYESIGDPAAPAIVLVMGLGMQLTAWPDPFCHGLAARGFRVIRFDNRDIGLSTGFDRLGAPNLAVAMFKYTLRLPVRAGYLIADMARDTVGLMDALALPRAHVVGVSMGGMIAQLVAAAEPARVVSLTSIMSSSGARRLPGPTREVMRIMMRRPPPVDDFDRLLDHYVELWKAIGSPGYPISDAEIRERMTRALRRAFRPHGTARQMLAVIASGDRSRLLASIKAPTLVIHGTADPLVPPACGKDTAAKIPGARLKLIEGMGHDMAAFQQLVPLIAEHCREADAQGARR